MEIQQSMTKNWAAEFNELNNLSEAEKALAIQILQQMSEKGSSKQLEDLRYSDFDEIPVSIHTFMHDRKFLGNALYDPEGRFTIFPYWESKLEEIFPTPTETRYNTIVFTGAIGLGKSTIAVICLLYMLYRLLCLKDPYLYYGMQPIDKISISLMNITLENAKGVALDKMNQMILASEWFMSHGKMSGTTNLNFTPDKHIELITASSNNQVIGRALFANFTDEVNFGLTSDVEKLKKKQKTLISQVDARMKSRFMRGTYLPTMNIIASSKNSEQSFLEDFINSKKQNESKNTLIVDEPQWVVDSRKDSPIKFWVAVGNKFLANEVLPLDAPDILVEEYRAKGYSMIHVPIGYRENFVENLDGALQDIAGIATASSLKYISGMRWNECVNPDITNPFTKEIIEVGNAKEDKTQYSDYFDLSKVPSDLKSRPLYIHLDMSISGDKTGIAGAWIKRKKSAASDGQSQSKSLFFRAAFSVAVQAPRGAQISFEKNKNFIYWLRDNGFNVKKITADTYQSAAVLQDLTAHGFDCEVQSVDRLTGEGKNKICEPYHYFKTAIYDGRIEIYKTQLLTEEVVGLERLSDGHIDHTTEGINSKDISDALCGSIFEASKHADEFAFDYGEDIDTTLTVSGEFSDQLDQINQEFQAELQRMFDPFTRIKQQQEQEAIKNKASSNTDKSKTEEKPDNSGFVDFGFGKAQKVNTNYISQGIVLF